MRARIERATSEPIKITKQVAGEREIEREGAGSRGREKVSTLGPKMVTLKPGAMTRTGSAAERQRKSERGRLI